MSNRFEETAGKVLLIAVFGYLAAVRIIATAQLIAAPSRMEFWPLAIVSQFGSLIFIGLVVAMTVRRLPAKSAAEGIEPRLTAIAGTFALLVLGYLPSGHPDFGVRLFSTALIGFGTALSIYCLHVLGRSFSVMASARQLVTDGPYSIVRHPLYAAEAATTLGIIMAQHSMAAVFIGLLQILLQFRRMQHEERVLLRAFPEYTDYVARVPMIIPRLRHATR